MSMSSQPLGEATSTPKEFQLIERVVERENMRLAYSRVLRNKGSAGIDKMKVEDLASYLKTNWPQLKEQLLSGTYKPKPVKRVDIPKPGGGTRQLGVPTVVDRLIQQAVHQVLTPIFDPGFSESSYGFRPGKSAHQAIKKAKQFLLEGKRWVVDVDLARFFDEVNHDMLMSRIARKIGDKRLLHLIRNYLQSGVMVNGVVCSRGKGTMQGGPLSPLLSNVLLDDFDKELERRGHSFCRYADDSNVYVATRRSAERVMSSIKGFLEKKMKLQVNQTKSATAWCHQRKFLGYSFTSHKKPRIRVPKESLKRLRFRLLRLFRMGKGRNLETFIRENLNPVLKGWINYFSLAEVKSFAEELDQWIRRRLRLILWRQWKRSWTRRARLIELGLAETTAVKTAFSGRGPWHSSRGYIHIVTRKSYFDRLGLVSMLDELKRIRMVNSGNRLGT
jgi:RNA-directed DNA polymerase